MIPELSDIRRRIENIVRMGKIEFADYTKARVRVRIGNVLTNWIPWVTTRAGGDVSFWAPEVDEQVLVFSPGGETSLGVCLPAIYQSAIPANADDENKARIDFENGSSVEHDRETGVLKVIVPNDGKVEIQSGGDVTVVASGTLKLQAASIEITGPITHTGGDIASDRNFTTSEEVTASGIKLSSHKHSGVQSGGAQTGNPV